eukprot:m.188305 g.188305  ORF g.188305 m.188305 type:complete len:51 (+) comp18524_c0_seq6:1240-1392(+)
MNRSMISAAVQESSLAYVRGLLTEIQKALPQHLASKYPCLVHDAAPVAAR